MKWYVAEIIVQCRIQGKSEDPSEYDRQIKVLRAADHESAYQRALALGQAENHSYENLEGGTVHWEFVGLANLAELLDNEIEDGTEIYSWLQRGDPKAEVRSKQDLHVFWYERNKDRTARELIEADDLLPNCIARSRPQRKPPQP